MKRIIFALIAVLLASPALAQLGVPNHGVPVSRGAGSGSMNSVGPCLSGVPIIGAGVSSDPHCHSAALGTMAAQNANAVAITGGTITGMPNPTLGSDVVNKTYADSIAAGLSVKTAVQYATAAVLPNTPTYANGASGVGATLTSATMTALVVDGASPSVGNRVLVKNQASTLQNGAYSVTVAGSGGAAWVLTRTTDFDAPAEMTAGSAFLVLGGTANIGTGWTLQGTVAAVGTDPANFAQYTTLSGALIATNNLSDVASVSTSRTNLGLGTIATQNANNVAITGGTFRGTPVESTYGGLGINAGASAGVPLFASGVPTFTPTTGSGNFMRAGAPTMSGNLILNGNWLSGDGGNEGVFVNAIGWVGVNLSSPSDHFHVHATTDQNVVFSTNSNGLDTGSVGILSINDALSAYKPLTFLASRYNFNIGNVGINQSSPTHVLDVNGNIGIAAGGYFNAGPTDGTSGYGFRDNVGTMQVKNSGGSWTNIPTAAVTQWTTSGSNIYYNTGGVLVGTTSAVTGSTVDVNGSLYLSVTNPTMQQGKCWGFFDTCETNGILSVVTYDADVTSGSAIRGDVSRTTNARVISGVSGTAKAVNSSGDITGVLGSTLYLGGGSGYAVWGFTYMCAPGSIEPQCAGGTGITPDDLGMLAGVNRGEIVPHYGLLISKEGFAELNNIGCCRTAIYMTDFTERGISFLNLKSAPWPIYSADGSGNQNFGVDITGHVSFQGATSAATTLCYNTTDHAPMATIAGCSSDQRLKNEREKIPDGALQRVLQLIPRTFSFKTTPDKIEGGFFAQEVERAMPHATYTNPDGMMGINTNAMLAEITKAIQELAAKNATLESCLASWECRLFGKGN